MELPSIITQNPILFAVLLMDGFGGVAILRNMLHPYLGNFDIALILEPMGERGLDEATRKFVLKAKGDDKPALLMMSARVEFNPLRKGFTLGKKEQGLMYTIDPSSVAFIQRTHRVYYYIKDRTLPVKVGYGVNPASPSSRGMFMLIIQKLWGQAVAATQKTNMTLPIFVAILCVVAGLGGGFSLFYALHTQLGFVPYSTPVSSSVTTSITTGTLGK